MQHNAGQLEEELMNMKRRLSVVEEERDRFYDELTEMKKLADDANGRLSEAISNGKVADIYSELNSAIESLSKSNKEIKVKEIAISALKVELERVKELESRLADKDLLLEKLKDELCKTQSSEARALELLHKSKGRVQELEREIESGKDSASMMLDSLAETKMLLEESKLEGNISEDQLLLQKEIESLRSEFWVMKESERNAVNKAEGLMNEMELLKFQLKQAAGAEENSQKAMEDLAFALKEVATEASQTKDKLIMTEEKYEKLKREAEELKQKLRHVDDKHKRVLEEVRAEAELYKNTADRLLAEAEETLVAWNEKETGLVECIKIAEEEKTALIEENNKLVEALKAAETINRTAKQENQYLRDILKQAINESNVAKEAAEIARVENSQLKDLLAEKDDALIFITRENENLRVNEANANENIKELKRLLEEASSGKEIKAGEDNNKEQTPPPQHHHRERKLSNAFSINLKDLIISTKPKDTPDDVKVSESKQNDQTDEKDDLENIDPLKGSIFDVDSPVAAPPPADKNHHHHHHRRKSLTFADEGEGINPEELEYVEGAHNEEGETEKNPKKKKALLRRFGDIIIRRKSVHRRDSSIGGDAHKKELAAIASEANKKESLTASGGEGNKQEISSSSTGGEGQKKENSPGGDQTHKKEPSLGE